MVCCKCEEHKWIYRPPAEIIDGDKCYCLFHAPEKLKGKSVEDFNKQVFERIKTVKDWIESSGPMDFCEFDGTIFPGDISFEAYDETNPLPKIFFTLARFCGGATFSEATFSNTADFCGARFMVYARFYQTKFKGVANFWRAEFLGETHFSRAEFISGEANFRQAKFTNKAYFDKAIFSCQTLFENVEAPQNALRMHSLSSATLANLSFTSLETELFSFKGCDWPEMLLPEADGLQSGKDCKGLYRDNKACEELYRSLKQKAAAEHDQPMTSWWHFREKLMKLEGVKIKHPKLWHIHWLGLYWLLCGFGERWVPPLRTLRYMLYVCLLILALGGVKSAEVDGAYTVLECQWWPLRLPSWEGAKNVGTICLSLLKYLLLIKEESIEFRPIHGAAEFLILLFTRLIIPIQAAFFAIALRNAYRR